MNRNQSEKGNTKESVFIMARQKRVSVPEALRHGMGWGVDIYVILCLHSYYLSWFEISFFKRLGKGAVLCSNPWPRPACHPAGKPGLAVLFIKSLGVMFRRTVLKCTLRRTRAGLAHHMYGALNPDCQDNIISFHCNEITRLR